jgi:hypothetical protein
MYGVVLIDKEPKQRNLKINEQHQGQKAWHYSSTKA